MSAALNSDRWELARVCDINPDVLQHRLREFDFKHGSTAFDDLLNDPGIDAIAIYTPDPLHADHVIACLNAGKHVICTKPLFDDLTRAAEVYDAWRASGKELFVGQSSRFFEPMIHQRRDYSLGKHGELWSVEAHYHHDHREYAARTWAKGKINWVYGGLSHPVDLVRWYLPNIDEVFGYGVISPAGRALGAVRPDCLHFVFKSLEGKVGRVSGCYGLPQVSTERDSYVTCILRGDQGSSQADYYELRYATNFAGEGPCEHTFEHRHGYYFRFEERSNHAGEFHNYIDYVADEISAGRRPLPDLAEGIWTIATLRAMELSVERQQPVRVREVMSSYRLEHVPLRPSPVTAAQNG